MAKSKQQYLQDLSQEPIPHEKICNVCRADIFCRSFQYPKALRPEKADSPSLGSTTESTSTKTKSYDNLHLRLASSGYREPDDYDLCIDCASDIEHWPHRAQALVRGLRIYEDVSRDELYKILFAGAATVNRLCSGKQVREREYKKDRGREKTLIERKRYHVHFLSLFSISSSLSL